MRIRCTFPGRAGDLLWALPSVRAIAERFNTRIDLQIADEFVGMIELLAQQPYLYTIFADPHWAMDGRPAPDWDLPGVDVWDRTFHLGYDGWPELPLPKTSEARMRSQWKDADGPAPAIDLTRPWMTVTDTGRWPCDLAVGFTETWFELKVGLLTLLHDELPRYLVLVPRGSRWASDADIPWVHESTWVGAAQIIQSSQVFFGDCSALHVLAVAMGKPVILVEPMEARHNSIFFPLGTDGSRGVTLIHGTDGKPSFDVRHCADAIREAFHAR